MDPSDSGEIRDDLAFIPGPICTRPKARAPGSPLPPSSGGLSSGGLSSGGPFPFIPLIAETTV
ncbi:hypothetical protein GCM10010961_23740 [Pseudodonghicola xiamenensis]|uniref:Uncharacterized protein n=1 Tax=Pseudodonghicola xiamenensis TaxID=337702 RepID=A0A8J3H914_9RHOB|nr:hypothetical protein GCM10010961_23740 [Pseudodonghicola xiamenensis]